MQQTNFKEQKRIKTTSSWHSKTSKLVFLLHSCLEVYTLWNRLAFYALFFYKIILPQLRERICVNCFGIPLCKLPERAAFILELDIAATTAEGTESGWREQSRIVKSSCRITAAAFAAVTVRAGTYVVCKVGSNRSGSLRAPAETTNINRRTAVTAASVPPAPVRVC